ncbi:endonuclease/exonuclease/phosphatase family protein [Mumia qirimensis]|uniref:endonuclease/exonuclease/phosphatase family protein n=1 Tax=Mumia qirimensis TaxID=3234852 RepID=UPI00351DA930
MTGFSRFSTAVASATTVVVALTTPGLTSPAPATAATSSTAAAVTPAAMTTAVRGRTTVRVGSYNVHKDDRFMPWTAKRRDRVARQILRNRFDVVALQETHGMFNFPSLRRKVKHRFAATARCGRIRGTEVRDARTRILYNPSRFSGSREISGRILLDRTHKGASDYGCYQLLTEKATGARFLVASVHLATGATRAMDLRRYRQTRNLINDTLAVRRAHGAAWPIVWAGDYNSSASRRYTFDAPKRAMRQMAGARDAYAVARTRRNGSYNSANQLRPKPWRTHHHVDHVYVSPGIGVSAFRVVIRLDGKRYRTPFASDHNPIKATLRIPY